MKKKSIGFSLLEMLVVIAVIGIMAAITIPNIVDNSKKPEAAHKRTAQQIAAVVNAAAAAGYDFVEENDGDINRIVSEVRIGHKIDDTSSPFYEQMFQVIILDPTDAKEAKKYLRVQNGLLTYVPTLQN